MTRHLAHLRSHVARPFLITFSGIDGAVKTTQIEYLAAYLQERGLGVSRLTFWDDVAIWSRMRAGIGHRALDFGRVDTTADSSFSPKNNKHVRNRYLTAVRSGFYILDVARLRRLLATPEIQNSDVVIFDRYIYDQIANIYSQSFTARIYSKILLSQTPAPDVAFVLDASPAAAFARKPEYPLEFVLQNRQNFLRLRELVPQLIIVPDAAAEDVRDEISCHLRRSRLAEHALFEGRIEATGDNAVVPPQSSCRVRNHPTASV